MHLRHSLPFESKVSKARFENGTLKCFFTVVVKNEVNDGLKPCEATHSQWAALCCRGQLEEQAGNGQVKVHFCQHLVLDNTQRQSCPSPLMYSANYARV